MLEQKLFDVHSTVLHEAGELNQHVPKQNIQEYQYDESDYSVGKGFGSKEQGNFFLSNLLWTNVKDSTGHNFICTVIN